MFLCVCFLLSFWFQHIIVRDKVHKKGLDVTLSTTLPSPAVILLIILLCMFQFYLQDTKSSNGTFINNQRLSKGSEESPPRELFSGDIVQFGVDVLENARRGNFAFCFLS